MKWNRIQLKIAGLVCKKFSATSIHARARHEGIQDYFERPKPGGYISDVDTRAMVRHVRDKGAMNAIISSEESGHSPTVQMNLAERFHPWNGLELVIESLHNQQRTRLAQSGCVA